VGEIVDRKSEKQEINVKKSPPQKKGQIKEHAGRQEENVPRLDMQESQGAPRGTSTSGGRILQRSFVGKRRRGGKRLTGLLQIPAQPIRKAPKDSLSARKAQKSKGDSEVSDSRMTPASLPNLKVVNGGERKTDPGVEKVWTKMKKVATKQAKIIVRTTMGVYRRWVR